jgi:hypothetical protein
MVPMHNGDAPNRVNEPRIDQIWIYYESAFETLQAVFYGVYVTLRKRFI